MYPTLFRWHSFAFHSYTVMFALAFLVGTILPIWENAKREKPYPITTMGGVWIFFGGVFGAKLYWVIQYGGWEDLRYLMFLWTGGLVFFGGLIGGVMAGVAYLRWVGAPVVGASDLVLPYVALAHGIARVGCFLNGCCWGAVTTLPWGVCYPRRSWGAYDQQRTDGLLSAGSHHSLPVHPTQLYETVGLIVIFFILRYVYKRRKTEGVIVAAYPMLYGALRFVVECFRGDSYRPVLGLTVSQCVALLLFFGGASALIWWKRSVISPSENNVESALDIYPEKADNQADSSLSKPDAPKQV